MIKWIRLKNICEKLCERPVHIHASTDVSHNYIAGCEFNSHNVNIILNMENTKSDDLVIKALAHEVCHVLENNKRHGDDFDIKWLKLEQEIREGYEK
jgi:hypothetical protein